MVWKSLASLFTLPDISGWFSQRGMTEIELGAHTVRSHGASIAKEHMQDWLILLLLVVIEVILHVVIHPFYRFVGRNMMSDLMYPMKGNTVPGWSVPMYCVLLPITIFLIFYFRRRDVYDLHHSVLGLLFSVLITAIITDAIKDATGRPRPDFFWRCFPDGKATYDAVTGGVICHGDPNVIKEGHKSFPSGHTSGAFAGLGFLSLYLSGKIKAFDRRGHVAKLCIVILPLLMASLVGVSRVDDYWHHWQDVFAGGLIGYIVATFCYLQFFPAPYHEDGWAPHASHRVREASRSSTNPNQPLNASDTQRMEDSVVNSPARQDNELFMPSLAHAETDVYSPNPDLESGRRGNSHDLDTVLTRV